MWFANASWVAPQGWNVDVGPMNDAEEPQRRQITLTLLISGGTCELVSLSLEIELWHSPPITAISVLKFCSWWSFCDTQNRWEQSHCTYQLYVSLEAASCLSARSSLCCSKTSAQMLQFPVRFSLVGLKSSKASLPLWCWSLGHHLDQWFRRITWSICLTQIFLDPSPDVLIARIWSWA